MCSISVETFWQQMQRYLLLCFLLWGVFAVLLDGTVKQESGIRYQNSISHGEWFSNYKNSLCGTDN